MNVPDMSYRKKHKDAMIRVVELETLLREAKIDITEWRMEYENTVAERRRLYKELNAVRELIKSVVEDNDIDGGYMRLRSYWDFEEQQLKGNNDE